MKPIVYLALSGGVDSSVAAALLQRDGFQVRAVFMRYWGDVDDIIPGGEDFTNCCNIEAMNDAQKVCDHLGIPLQIMDLREKFRTDVVQSFLRGYEQGNTPNPCVECNRSIKFELIEKILAGASEDEKEHIYFATGHYIRTTLCHPGSDQDPIASSTAALLDSGQARMTVKLFVATDTRKDQSYFLYTLTQEKLKRLLFPLGRLTKPEVRALALEMNLPVALKKESQEVCFVKKNVNTFLESRIKTPQPGQMVATTGELLGEHRGLPFYTIGQREGLGLGGGGPYFVAAKDPERNALIIAHGDESSLYKSRVTLRDVNWVSGVVPEEPIQVLARPRYRHPGASATVTESVCVFDAPERALTPGQSIVFYKESSEGTEVLGGGIVEAVA